MSAVSINLSGRKLPFDIDINQYHVQRINEVELNITYKMVKNEPTIKAALKHYYRFLKLNDLELKGPDSDNPLSVRQIWHRKYVIPTCYKIIERFVTHGFCPLIKHYVEIDAKKDKAWMKKFKSVRDSGSKTPNYMVELPVLTVPDNGLYESYMLLNKQTLSAMVLCLHKEDKTSRERLPIYVITSSGTFDLPDAVSGNLQSPISALIYSYEKLRQYESFAVNAHYNLANPTILLTSKNTDSKDDVLSRENNALLREQELLPHMQSVKDNPNKRYKEITERQKRRMRQVNEQREQSSKRFAEEISFYSNPILRSEDIIEFSRPIQTAIELDEDVEVSKNSGPQPVPPIEMHEKRLTYVSEVGRMLGLPYALFSNEKIGSTSGGGKYADADLKLLKTTTYELQSEMEHIFSEIMTLLELDGGDDDEEGNSTTRLMDGENYEFVLHSQPFIDFEMILELYLNKLLTKNQISKLLEDTYAIEPDANASHSSTTITDDVLLEMHKNEGLSTRALHRGMKQIHGDVKLG